MTLVAVPRTRATLDILAGVHAALGIRRRSEAAAGSGDPLTNDDKDLLYLEWYLDAEPEPVGHHQERPAPWQVDLVSQLRAGHAADGRFEEGWRVVRLSSLGRVHLEREGSPDRVVFRGDVLRRSRPFLPLRPGDVVEVSSRHDHEDASGFWFTFLGGWDPEHPPDNVVRIYWAVNRSSAAALVHHVTGRMKGLACSLKIAVGEGMVGRPDAAVLYLSAGDLHAVLPLVKAIRRDLGAGVRDRTPPLALRLAPGLALAEEPPGGQMSFGQHRCAALMAAAADGPASDNALVRRARRRLVEAGIDAQHPYRNLGRTLSADATGTS